MDVAKIMWQKWQFQPKICMNQMDPNFHARSGQSSAKHKSFTKWR